jgi:hypothetical protein
MKKKEKTFADRAKDIKAKYPRAEWDKIERKDMMKELGELRDEQEETRAAMGVADGADAADEQEAQGVPEESSEQRMGGRMYATGGNFGVGNIGGMNQHLFGMMPRFGQDMNSLSNNSLVDASSNNMSTMANKFTTPTDSFAPFAISAGASILGDIAGLINANRNLPKSVSLPRIAPSNISLEPQRNALQRAFNTSGNMMLRNSRDVSNPSNAYANQIAGITALTDSYGNQMGQSYMNEANANQQANLQVNSRNAGIAGDEAQMNNQLKTQRYGVNAQYINSLSQTIPSALRDYRQQVNQTNTINNMGKDYGSYAPYNPNMNSWQKFIQGLMGQQTQILNRNNTNIIG